MVDSGQKAAKQLSDITECSICMCTFIDPRVLPCIHTFCFRCLKGIGDTTRKRPGDNMPCPLCRKEFTIPLDGISSLQKNFFMDDVLECRTTLQTGSATTATFVSCDMCVNRSDVTTQNLSTATKSCLECQQNYCNSCSRVHRMQAAHSNHRLANIGSEIEEETRPMANVKSCTKHSNKPLDFYCSDCKRIVCVSCFVESHKSHDCNEIAKVDEEFRKAIQKRAWKIQGYADEMLTIRQNVETKKVVFLRKMIERKNAIYKRNQELKDMIDQDTKSLLVQLSVVEASHLKEIENEMEEIEKSCSALRLFEAYCTEIGSNGSTNDICSSFDEVIGKAQALQRDHEAFVGRPLQSIEVYFQATDLRDALQKSSNNFVGQIKVKTDSATQYESYAIVVGLNDVTTITEDVIKINLRQPNEITHQTQLPTKMAFEAVAEVHSNTMYVTGIGFYNDEIWKYNMNSGWTKCASLVQGRRRHSAAFIDEVLYICGGFVDSNKGVLNSVEAYDTVTDKCSTVGKLLDCVHNAGNCVPFRSSLYIFGGVNKDSKALSRVQVYDTKHNKCTRIFKPMPRHYNLMRTALWGSFVVLLGWETCFLFNLETQNWEERKHFKTDVVHFGLAVENERVFVIGGGFCETDKDGKSIWKCMTDVRCVPLRNIVENKPIEWKIHARLPKPVLVQTYCKLTCLSTNAKQRASFRQ